MTSPERSLLGTARAAVLLATTALLSPSVSAGAGESPREVVGRTTDTVAATLRNSKLSEHEKQTRVEEAVNQAVDFETVSKLVLARNYRKCSSAQRETFLEEFKHHLMFTYWKDASSVEFERIDITGERKELRKDWTVKTEVVQGADKTSIDYRLRLFGASDDSPGEWRIIDLTVEGVSLVANFRSQFQSIVANDGPEGLIELLRKKNAAARAATKERDGG